MPSASDVLILTFFDKYPTDAARLLETLVPEQAAGFLTPFPARHIATVLQYTLPTIGAAILQALPDQAVPAILSAMNTSSAISILRHSPNAWQASTIGKLDPHANTTLFQALTYPDCSAGQLADAHVLILTEDRSVSDAIQWIRRTPPTDTTSELYIIDRLHHLLGRVPIQTLLTADLESPLGKIMEPNMEVLQASWPFDQLITRPQWEITPILPVVNEIGTFLGVIRYPQLVRVQQVTRSPNERRNDIENAQSNCKNE